MNLGIFRLLLTHSNIDVNIKSNYYGISKKCFFNNILFILIMRYLFYIVQLREENMKLLNFYYHIQILMLTQKLSEMVYHK